MKKPMIVKKRVGRNPLPTRDKKKQITLSFYISPKALDEISTNENTGEEIIRQSMADYFKLTFGNEPEPSV